MLKLTYNICMADFSMVETGKRIRELRKGMNMSQRELAERAGVAQNTVSQYENGTSELSLSVLANFAKILDTTADYLLGLSEY